MEDHQLRILEQLVEKLKLSEGELRQISNEVSERRLVTLYEMNRQETDRLIVYLDSLLLAGVR